MTVAPRRHNIVLGLNGAPFSRYTIQYGIVAPDNLDDGISSPSSPVKCPSPSSTGCSVVEAFLTVGVLLIISLYAVDCNLELRQTKLQIHLAICTVATLMSIIHIAVQILVILRSDQTPSLYEHAAVELLADSDVDHEETRSNFGDRCHKLAAEGENALPVGFGMASVLAEVVLLIVLYAGRLDLGWTLIPSVLFPISISVFRLSARGRLYRKWAERDANVSRAVIMEAARLLREQQLTLPAVSPSSPYQFNDKSSLRANSIGSSLADNNALDPLERGQVCSDNVRRFISALRNTPCYSARTTGVRLHQHHHVDSQGDTDLSQKQRRGNGLEDSQKDAIIECRLVSVDVQRKGGDT